MAKLLVLAAAVAANAVAAQTAVATNVTPFSRGFNARCNINLTGVTGTPTLKVQTSPDGTTWNDALVLNVITRQGFQGELTLDNYARFNVTGAGSAGTVDCYLEP
jgi:hypothetical protein